jgi:hypothetical protein
MKRSILYLSLTSMLFTACKKDGLSAGEIQVNLAATTFYKDGSEETKRDRSGSFNSTSYGQLITEGSTNKFLVDLGATGTATTRSTFGVSFVFNQQTTVQNIAGSYNFPRDQAAIRVTLRNEVVPALTETLFFPTRGTVDLSYDSVNKKINGNIRDLEFNPLPNDAYNRYRITIAGSFTGVPVRF